MYREYWRYARRSSRSPCMFASVMKVMDPGLGGWLGIISMSLLAYVAGQIANAIGVTRSARQPSSAAGQAPGSRI